MLRTGKQVWMASAKVEALTIRNAELEFYMDRIGVLCTNVGVEIGVVFLSLLHLRNLPEELEGTPVLYFFYGSLFACLMLAIYVIAVSTILVIFARQASMLGEDGSEVERAVEQLRSRRVAIFGSAFASLCCFFAAGCSLIYIKLANGWYSEDQAEVTKAASILMVVAVGFCCLVGYAVIDIFTAIGRGRNKLISGGTVMVLPGGVSLDLGTLQPDAGTGVMASQKGY